MNEIIKIIREKENKIFNVQNKCDEAFFYLDQIKRCIIDDPLNPPSDIKPDVIISWFDSLSLQEKNFLGLNEMYIIFSYVYKLK